MTNELKQTNIEKAIKFICLALGVLAIYKWGVGFVFLVFLIKGSPWDLTAVLYLLDLIVLPLSLFQLWKLRKIGQRMLTGWLIYNLIGAVSVFVVMISGSEVVLPYVYPTTDTSSYFYTSIYSIAILIYINRKDVRAFISSRP